MFKENLKLAGLSENQATIYELLLTIGETKASAITKQSPLKRGLIYKTLNELVEKELVQKTEQPQTVTVFKPMHPAQLKKIVDAEEQRAKNAKKAVSSVLDQMISEYNLASDKPGIRFFEGMDGIKEVLTDAIENNPQKEILVFSGLADYIGALREWNTSYYTPRRKKLGIKEKAIVPNHQKTIDWLKGFSAHELTEIIFTDHVLFSFSTEINIYNNRVSFVTFAKDYQIGVLIDNKEIYETMKTIFMLSWQLGKHNQPNNAA